MYKTNFNQYNTRLAPGDIHCGQQTIQNPGPHPQLLAAWHLGLPVLIDTPLELERVPDLRCERIC